MIGGPHGTSTPRAPITPATPGSRSAPLGQEGGSDLCVQVDVARVGGITHWLKVARAAEAFNVAVSPHFLMESHVSLAAAVPNGIFVEHIP